MHVRWLYIILLMAIQPLSATAAEKCCRLLSYACNRLESTYSSRTDSLITPSETDSVVVPENRSTTPPDSVRQDSTTGFGLVFDAFDKVITTAPKLEQILSDSVSAEGGDINQMSTRKKRLFLSRFIDDQLVEWNNIDTTYIMPQLYDYAVMFQTTTSFEDFSISSLGENEQTLRFAPNPTFRLGGYFGWRWLFLGYTFDVGGILGNKHGNTKKVEWDLSLYTSKVGIDLYWRQTGNDFRCKNLNDLFSAENPRPDGLTDDFSGLDIMTRGVNVYYIFNHRNFSYPAAFSQSTCQRRSCGTFKLGLSVTYHKVSLDESKFDPALTEHLNPALFFNNVKYNDYSINFGYAYNWVFAKNWLLSVSFSPGLAYNVTYYNIDNLESGSEKEEDSQFRHFSFDKLNLDFITRVGLVYNNTKYFAGMSFRFHSFDYKNRRVRMNNSFAYLNFYVGLNFKKKKKI